MNGFKQLLDAKEIGESGGRAVWKLDAPLVFVHGLNTVSVPAGFETDLASVPRVPLIYTIWGDRAHREAVLHDYLYRKDAVIQQDLSDPARVTRAVEKEEADWFFRLAMITRGQPYYIYQPMYLAVRVGGRSSFHRMNVMDSFKLDKPCEVTG